MKLIGLFDSPYVRRVAVSMRLQGHDFEHVALSVFRHYDRMREINPLVKVPMLVLDDGEKLIESSFILDHLDEIAGPERRLIPAAGAERRRVLQQCAVGLVACEKAVQLYYEHKVRPREVSWAGWAERCMQQMHEAFAMLDGMEQTGVLAGRPLNQADITAAVALGFARLVHPAEMTAGRYPMLERVSQHCEALPAFVQTPMV